MGVALALGSALCFGLSDFAAGLAARRLHSAVVVLVRQLCGVVLVALLALFVAAPNLNGAALGWGALSGIGTGLGAAAGACRRDRRPGLALIIPGASH